MDFPLHLTGVSTDELPKSSIYENFGVYQLLSCSLWFADFMIFDDAIGIQRLGNRFFQNGVILKLLEYLYAIMLYWYLADIRIYMYVIRIVFVFAQSLCFLGYGLVHTQNNQHWIGSLQPSFFKTCENTHGERNHCS